MSERVDIARSGGASRIDDEDYERYLLKNPYEKSEKRAQQTRVPERGGGGQQGGGQQGGGLEPADAAVARPRKRSARVIAVVLVALAVVGGAGLGVGVWFAVNEFVLPAVLPPDISAYAEQGISISGLGSEDFIVTPAELLALEVVTESATGTGGGQMGESKTGTVTSYGPYMETFLQSHGHTLSDFGRIRVLCKDGYSVTYRPELLEGAIIMSVADNHSPLAHYQQPLRMVIPGDKTGNWAFGVLRIEFVR